VQLLLLDAYNVFCVHSYLLKCYCFLCLYKKDFNFWLALQSAAYYS